MKPLFIALILLIGNLSSRAAATPWATSGTHTVDTVEYTWQDTHRQREVPVKIYYPATGAGPFPIIIFSHGLGGTREGYEYLGRYWASHGYISVHVQHHGSDDAVWRDVPPLDLMPALRRSVANLSNSVNRPLDILFALNQLDQLNTTNKLLAGRLDLKSIGVSGHSFGAFTTLAIAGEVFVLPSGQERSITEPRIIAAIAMSESVPPRESEYDLAFSKIKIPVMHMTGTKDDSPVGETKAAQRRIPFDHIKASDQYLVDFEGGDHMIFSGRMMKLRHAEQDEIFQKLICQTTTAFWDAYLKHNESAKKWLTDGEAKSLLNINATLESK